MLTCRSFYASVTIISGSIMFATVCPRHSEPRQTSRLSAGLLSSRPGSRPALGDNLFFRKPKCDEPFENSRKRKIKISTNWGWSGGAMVLGKLPVLGRPTIWMIVGQGPIALAVGAGGGCLDIFTLLYPFSPLSPSLWETARYRLKYCLKGPLNPKQPTNQLYKLEQMLAKRNGWERSKA